MDKILDQLYALFTTFGVRLISAIIVFVVGWIIVGMVTKRIRKGTKIDGMARAFLASFVNFGGKTLVVIIAISILGVEMTSIVAILASAGVAIGLALQGSLSNIAGGILLVIFKPFKVGDYIKVAGEEGTVTDMNLFYTILKKPDNVTVSIPNATASNSSLENLSIEGNRRVDFTVNVARDSDTEKVQKILLAIASNHDLVIDEPAPFCRLSSFSENGFSFVLRVWTKNEDYWTVNFDINESIEKAFKLSGVELSYNQVQVKLDNGEDKQS